jgi:hypothetical protein
MPRLGKYCRSHKSQKQATCLYKDEDIKSTDYRQFFINRFILRRGESCVSRISHIFCAFYILHKLCVHHSHRQHSSSSEEKDEKLSEPERPPGPETVRARQAAKYKLSHGLMSLVESDTARQPVGTMFLLNQTNWFGWVHRIMDWIASLYLGYRDAISPPSLRQVATAWSAVWSSCTIKNPSTPWQTEP